MADRFVVSWSEAAQADLTEIILKLAGENPAAAEHLLAAIERRAATLDRFANRGRVVPELARFNITAYRELIEGAYRLVYSVEGRRVAVLVVVDGHRDLPALLLTRLVRP